MNYILISDFCLSARNRGTAALGYGALSFLRDRGYLDDDSVIVTSYSIRKNPFVRDIQENKKIQGKKIVFKHLIINTFEYKLYQKFNLLFSFLPFGKFIKNLRCVAAINGGDGFSDIYGDALFNSRNPYSFFAMKTNVPLVLLPQTIGPFKHTHNLQVAKAILEYAKEVFVRDKNYTECLDRMGIKYEFTRDLSAYMAPEPWDIDIKPNSIGINVSGLAYSNKFLDLAGQFEAYPDLINKLICHFRDLGNTVYIIPHAYGYYKPEENNDDMVACREAYSRLNDKTNVVLIDRDMESPQIKYVISKMNFFCGTRMHANFAAIYTGVPVFGLSYSYKFEGAFDANGLDSKKQTYRINNMKTSDINAVISKIDLFYNEKVVKNGDGK